MWILKNSKHIHKYPSSSTNCSGLLSNRCLAPCQLECFLLYFEKTSHPSQILGHPVMKTLRLWALCCECQSLRKRFKLGVVHSLVQKLLPAVFAGFLFQIFFFFVPATRQKQERDVCERMLSLFLLWWLCILWEGSKVPGAVCLFM